MEIKCFMGGVSGSCMTHTVQYRKYLQAVERGRVAVRDRDREREREAERQTLREIRQ